MVVFENYPNVVVNALAGTGKTTTIKEAVNRLLSEPPRGFKPSEEQKAIIDMVMRRPSPGQIHMTSFSTDATEQLKEGLPKTVGASSTYGMGLAAAKRNGLASRVDRGDWKYGAILTDFMRQNDGEERYKGMRIDLLSLCGKARLNLATKLNDQQLEDLSDHYGIDVPFGRRGLFLDAINYMLQEGRKQNDYFDYVDMVWIPCLEGLIQPLYTHLFVDEYQDMGIAQQEICYRVARRIIAIGDPNQAIYGFIGADANATESFRRRLSTRLGDVQVMPLTCTRRCGGDSHCRWDC